MALDASLMNDATRAVFEEQQVCTQALPLKNADNIKQCMQLLHTQVNQPLTDDYNLQVLHALVNALLAMYAGLYHNNTNTGNSAPQLRVQSIAKDFRKLLLQKFITVKKPADYAAMLNISPAYLNEVVKQSTGLPVTYWIQQQVLLEARRLLYYTDMTVKEIAHALGFEDHTYFTRLFTKNIKCPPLAFRRQYRESSNHSH